VANAAATTRAGRQVAVTRLNWGCGPRPVPGWLNSDRLDGPGIDLPCDIRAGLPLPAASVDYAVAVHVLQDLAYADVLPALHELRRVLRPGGVLRLAVPDLERAIRAFVGNDPAYFYVPDADARSVGAKLVTQIVWYGSVRTPFTWDFLGERLGRAGFRDVARCAFGQTHSPWPDIVTLDDRPRESLFAEAAR
jgi:SAM-dependent methyltransferase